MKNWKRFIAACLSATMILSTPLTSFAESSISLNKLSVSDKEKGETENTTEQKKEFNKILSNKTPYQYLSSKKDIQSVLDAQKDEEIFQLKELMKYAYIHESDEKNRQSLDAYLLIVDNWKKRNVHYKDEQKNKLIQEALEKSNIYGTSHKDIKVVDIPTYMEYLQSIKKFDVPRYVEVLSGFELAKNDEELQQTKKSFKDFENQIYGFKEQSEKGDKKPANDSTQIKRSEEDVDAQEKAIRKIIENGDYIKVYYLIYDGEEKNVFSNFIVYSPYSLLEDGTLRTVINGNPDIFDYSNGGQIPIDVDINRGMHNGGQIPITEECTYNEKEGYVDIPAEHVGKDLTITVWQSRDSEFYQGLPDELKPQEDRRNISTYIFTDFFPSGTIPSTFSPKGCNVVELNASIDSINVGDVWNATGTTWYIANRSNADSYTWSDVAGAIEYDAKFSQGQIINITSCDNPIFNNIGGAGPEGKNWIFTGCLTQDNNRFSGVPIIHEMGIECIAKEGNVATFFMRAKCKGPRGQKAQTVGGFFKATMKNQYTMTYYGNGGLWGDNSTWWSETVTHDTDYVTQENFFTRPGYTFTGWNTQPDGSGDDWTSYIGKPWRWWYTWDVTLYAQWKPNVLTVDYYSNGGVWTGDNSWNSVPGANQYIRSWDFKYDVVDDHWNYGSFGLSKEGYSGTGYWGTTTDGGILVEQDERLTGQEMARRYGLDLSTGSKHVLVYAQWVPAIYTNYVSHWLWGFEHGEGTNNDKNAYCLTDPYTSFQAAYQSEFTLDKDKGTAPPNGTYLEHFSTSDLSPTGAWIRYPIGTKLTQPSKGLNFQADYEPYNYKITYNLDGGVNSSSNPASYNVLYGKELHVPKKEGYKFLGWEENLFVDSRVGLEEGSSKNGTTHTFVNTTAGNRFNFSKIQIFDRDYQNFIIEIANGTNGKVREQYTHNLDTGVYCLRFGANGSTDDSCSNLRSVYLEKGKTYTVTYDSTVTSSTVTMSNIKFIDSHVTGINAGKNATFTSASNLYSELANRKTEDVTLTAKWTPATYIVNYDGNGATSGQTPSSTHKFDEAKKLTANGFQRTGYLFNGWNTKADGSGTSYKDQQSVMNLPGASSGKVTLYAQWTPITYTINYHGNGSTGGSTASSTHVYDVAKNLTTNGFQKIGYTFIGWNTKTDGSGTSYKDQQSVKNLTTKNGTVIELYAQWKPNTYTIKYDGNGATSGQTPSSTHEYDVAKNLTANGFKKTGYTFIGWNTKANGSGISYKDQQSVKNLISANGGTITLYAQWKPHTYTIKYDGNTATGGKTPSSTHVYDVAKNLTANGFKKTGYTFIGWNTKANGSGTSYKDQQSVKNLTAVDGATITLYAQWKPNTYIIEYHGNGATGGTTPNSTHTYDEAKKLTPNGFHKDGYIFDGWNTKQDGSGTSYKDQEEVKNLTDVNKATIILYAKWKPITYHIHYKGNGALSGKDKTDSIIQKEITDGKGYTVKDNKGYTDFVSDKNTFKGWYSSSVVDSKEQMDLIYKSGSKLPLEVLQKIHEEQLKNHIVTDKGPADKDVVLYAVWDKSPDIIIPENFKDEFYEGTTVTRTDLLKGIAASDKIDGDLSKQIIITQIDYSAGKLNGSGKDKVYSQKWENGMPADAVLDTWFMKLDKNDSPIKHKVTYQVTDSSGNKTTATKEVRVIYNEFPEIVASDKYYSLEKAQNGMITEDALLKDLIKSGQLSATDPEEGDLSSRLELVDFDPTLFTSMKKEGFVPVTYRVRDTMGPNGNGKETLKKINVNITAVRPDEYVRYVRFINKEYYYKNANLDLSTMTNQEIALKAVNGGLHPKSKWYTDPEYRKVITKALDNNTPKESYQYTKEDIQKMRAFVKEHGIGNAKEPDALDKFAEIFMTGHYKIK